MRVSGGNIFGVALSAIGGFIIGGPAGAVLATGAYLIGSYLHSQEMASMMRQTRLPTAISPGDVSAGFSAEPHYPSSEEPVPFVLGSSLAQGVVVHKRIYGGGLASSDSPPLNKGYYIAVFGQQGVQLNQLYVDKVKIEDLPNYSATSKDDDHSWYEWFPNGGQTTIEVNNTGFIWFNTPESGGIAEAPVPAYFYGGGLIRVYAAFQKTNKTTGTIYFKFRIINIDTGEIRETGEGSYYLNFNHKDPETHYAYHTFTSIPAKSRWRVQVVETGGITGSVTTILRAYEIIDNGLTETIQAKAAFAKIHLKKVETISRDPVFTAQVESSDPDSDNPAVCLKSFLTSDWGLGIPSSLLDLSSFTEAEQWCNSHDFSFGRCYQSFYTPLQVIQQISTAGRLMLIFQNGKVKCKPDKDEYEAYAIASREVIPGSIKYGLIHVRRPNRIEAQYIDAGLFYTTQRLYVEDIEAIAEEGINSTTVDLSGVQSQEQAYKLASYILKVNKYCKYWLEFHVGWETAEKFEAGDVISLPEAEDDLVSGKKWRVTDIEETERLLFKVRCIEHNTEVYGEEAFTEWQESIFDNDHWWFHEAETSAAVVGDLEITDVTYPQDAGLQSIITLDFEPPQSNFAYAKIYWSHGNENYNDAGSAIDGPFTFTWPMRWGKLWLKVTSVYKGSENTETYALVSQYIEGLGNDYPGFGRGQFGYQPFGK